MTFFRYVETKMRCLWCYLFVVVLSIKWCLFFESLVIFLLPQFQFDSIIPHLLIKSTPKNFNFFLIYFRLFKIQFSALIVSFALMESQNSINSSSSMRGRCEERERVNPACLLKTFWRGNLSVFFLWIIAFLLLHFNAIMRAYCDDKHTHPLYATVCVESDEKEEKLNIFHNKLPFFTKHYMREREMIINLSFSSDSLKKMK